MVSRSTALQLVIEPVKESLKSAQDALVQYRLDMKSDNRHLANVQIALNHLSHVHAALVMSETHGAALLTEELNLLLSTLSSQASLDDTLVQAIAAIHRLTVYLDYVIDQKERPQILLKQINALRRLRCVNAISDSVLFMPNLDDVLHFQAVDDVESSDAKNDFLRKVRVSYERLLLSLVNQKAHFATLQSIHQIFVDIQDILPQSVSEAQTWRLVLLLSESIAKQKIAFKTEHHKILRRINQWLKFALKDESHLFNHQVLRDYSCHALLHEAGTLGTFKHIVHAGALKGELQAILSKPATRICIQANSDTVFSHIIYLVQSDLQTLMNFCDTAIYTPVLSGEALDGALKALQRAESYLVMLPENRLYHLIAAAIKHLELAITGDKLSDTVILELKTRFGYLQRRIEPELLIEEPDLWMNLSVS